MKRLDPEKLPVYFLAREFGKRLQPLCGKIERVRPDLADQLRRAAASVTLNIAEGAGELRPCEKARIYRIARRSATECASILDAALDERLVTTGETRSPREAVHRIVAQLVHLCKRLDAAPRCPARPR